jgi:hypothetical protein
MSQSKIEWTGLEETGSRPSSQFSAPPPGPGLCPGPSSKLQAPRPLISHWSPCQTATRCMCATRPAVGIQAYA